jgi:hypothetical protein
LKKIIAVTRREEFANKLGVQDDFVTLDQFFELVERGQMDEDAFICFDGAPDVFSDFLSGWTSIVFFEFGNGGPVDSIYSLGASLVFNMDDEEAYGLVRKIAEHAL